MVRNRNLELRSICDCFQPQTRDEVQNVEVLFFDIMKRMFRDTDFQQLQNQVQNLA